MGMKKGFFFSLFVITALSLLLIAHKANVDYREANRAKVYAARIEQINLFINDVEDDLERALTISGWSALKSIENQVIMTNTYVPGSPGAEAVIADLMLAGNSPGPPVYNMDDPTARLDIWEALIQSFADKYDVTISFQDEKITVSQDDPWKIRIFFECYVNMTDNDGTFSYYYYLTKTAYVSIESTGLQDPMYNVESVSNGVSAPGWANPIIKTSITNFAVPANLQAHMVNQRYRANPAAPSYLMRLEGLKTSDPNGIESFVNVFALYPTGANPANFPPHCAVDYQYFQNGCGAGFQHQFNTPTTINFYLDDAYCAYYGLSSVETGSSNPAPGSGTDLNCNT